MLPNDARSRTVLVVFILVFLGSLIASLQYVSETFSKSASLSKMTVSERIVTTEDKYYKDRHAYEYSKWIDGILPKNQLFNVYAQDNYMYYHSRFNYYLYPRYIPVNENVELQANFGNMAFLDRLPYGSIVFAISMKPAAGEFGILTAQLRGKTYFAVARQGDGNYLLVEKTFLKRSVLRDPVKWSAVYIEFSKLYPGKSITVLKGT